MDKEQQIKIIYKLVNGATQELSVSINVADTITESDNKVKALKKQDKRHLNGMQPEDCEYEISLREDDVLSKVLQNETTAQLHTAMDKLTEVQRRRVYLHYVYDLSYHQIAKAEGVGHKAVMQSVELAMKKLRTYYGV